MNLFNEKANRDLKEGDCVHTPDDRSGLVVAFSLFESDAVLVRLKEGYGRYEANELEVVGEEYSLEPLPPIVQTLTEGGILEKFWSCGPSLCFRITETSELFTIIPKTASNLREVFDTGAEFTEAIEMALDGGYVTRLPHLVESTLSKEIDGLLGSPHGEAIDKIQLLTLEK